MRRVRDGLARLGAPGAIALAVLAAIVLASLIGPLLSPYGVDQQDLLARNQGPSWSHPFGTGELGEDVLTRVLAAGRISLLVGLATAAVATLVGAGLGLLAGWRGGWVDSALSRLTDLFLILPAFVVLIVLSLTFERVGAVQVILILALMSWQPLFRLTRASALRTRELPYVQASRAAGARGPRIVRTHLLSAATPEIAAFAALAVGASMLAESALSFLSLGIDPAGSASWGTLMIGAQDSVEARPWQTVFPGMMILVTVLCVSLIGDGLRDALGAESGRRRLPRWP